MPKKYRSDEDFFAEFDKFNDTGSKDGDTGNSDEFFYGSGRNYRKDRQQTEAKRSAGKNEVKQTRGGASLKKPDIPLRKGFCRSFLLREKINRKQP